MNTETYTGTAEILKDRIFALIPDHPEILEMDKSGGLFRIEGFNCGDLAPSLAQAQWALGRAKLEWEERNSDAPV